jgi:hypothetical protein
MMQRSIEELKTAEARELYGADLGPHPPRPDPHLRGDSDSEANAVVAQLTGLKKLQW